MNISRFRCCTILVAAVLLAVTVLSPTYAQTQAINWTSYYSIPTTGTTPSSPTSVVYQGQLYLFTRGFDNHIHYNVLGSTWGPYLTVPGGASTSSAPEPVVLNGLLFVFTRGYSDSKIFYNSFDGTSWSGYQQVSGNATATAEPVPVVQDGVLFLFNLGAGDNKFYYNQSTNPYASGNYPWLGYSAVPPGTATSGSTLGTSTFTQNNIDEVFLFFRGGGNSVYYNTFLYDYYYTGSGGATLNPHWNNYYTQVPGGVATDSGPASVAYNGGNSLPAYNNLFLFFKGSGNGQVNYSMLNQQTNSWVGPFQVPYGPYGSTVGTGIAPNVAVYNNYLFVFQRGSDNKIYYAQGYY